MASHTPSILGRCGKLADATDDFLIKLQSGNTEKTQLYFLKVEVVNACGFLDLKRYKRMIPLIAGSNVCLIMDAIMYHSFKDLDVPNIIIIVNSSGTAMDCITIHVM